MNRIGIDPGVTGAVAILDSNFFLLSVHDMPVMSLFGLGNKVQVNPAELAKLLSAGNFLPPSEVTAMLDRMNGVYPANQPATVYLEQVNAMPGQGVTSMFNFGVSYGIVQGICGAYFMPLVMVRPNTWKKRAGLIGKPKDAARTLAQQLYPQADLSLKKHIGRADAILIARFGEK